MKKGISAGDIVLILVIIVILAILLLLIKGGLTLVTE